MVAIKAAHERLYDRDIWPGLPWTSRDTLRIQNECRQKAIASGITEHPGLQFAAAREYETYMSIFPRFGDRQKIMASIYPHKRTDFGVSLTEEEAQYLIDRLFGANDETGQRILLKLQSSLNKNEKVVR